MGIVGCKNLNAARSSDYTHFCSILGKLPYKVSKDLSNFFKEIQKHFVFHLQQIICFKRHPQFIENCNAQICMQEFE